MMQTIAAHLWQSTFFAVAAGLLTLAFRKNRAEVRYWLWLSASLKFLLPFALLLNLGHYLETRVPAAHQIAGQVATPGISYTLEQFSGTFPVNAPAAVSATGTIRWMPVVIVGIWLCGFIAVALVRFRNWLRIRAVLRESTATNISMAAEVRVAPGLLEPGVVGLLRPILLLPEGIAKHLTPEELNAILAHELCHIRRRDNLFASIHMMVEAIFWFHPLVWWIGARLIEEREQACDEEVLRLGNQPDVYADAILNVCKLYVESPLACVSGVSGASIRRRIEAIMSTRSLERLNRARKLLLAGAGFATVATPIVVGLLIGVGNTPVVRAQPTADVRPKFDVVSVRRCMPGNEFKGPPGPRGGAGGRGPRYSPGRLRVQCMAVGNMIRLAYLGLFGRGLLNYDAPPDDTKWLRNAPPWVKSEWYTVDAETDDPVANKPDAPGRRDSEERMEQMLQLVLEERFQLKIHRDSEEVPMYNLTVAKGGFKLKPMEPGGCVEHDPSKGVMTGEMFPPGQKPMCTSWLHMNGPDWALDAAGEKPGNLVAQLANTLNRHVFDKTGITDIYIFHLQFAHDETTPGNFPPEWADRLFPPTDVPSGPSIFTALEKIGLKLEPAKGPQGYMVVDHVERPSEN
jgi:uncharacterized protein (TIGR03435 family)